MADSSSIRKQPKLQDKDTNGDEEDRKGESVPRRGGGWFWLLKKDGSPATVQSSHKNGSEEKDDRIETKQEQVTPKSENNTPNAETVMDDKKPSDPENNRNAGSRWNWILKSDGSPATVDSPKAKEEATACADGTSSSPVVTKETCDERKQKQRSDPPRRGWAWILAPDGTPATIDDPTKSKTATTARKRKRGDSTEGGRRASKSRRSSRQRRNSSDTEPIASNAEDGINNSATNDVDSYYINKRAHAQWEEKFQLLVEYKNKHKTTRVPQTHPRLGKWVSTQRTLYRNKKLTKNRQRRLESLGFVFDTNMADWMKMYNQLLVYKKHHGGSTNVSQIRNRPNKYEKLAYWVGTQRYSRKTNQLSEKKIKLLESIGFDWKLSAKRRLGGGKAWMEMYQRLLEYKKKYKSTQVPRTFKADPRLARWVHLQRRYCIEEDRVDRLNYIGFEWSPLEDNWMDMYRRLLAYKQKYNTTRVPRDFKADPQLHVWVRQQRRTCGKEDRVNLLNRIGFEWNQLEENWMEMYQRLLAYQKKYKSTCVPYHFKSDAKLGVWVVTQRKDCRREDRVNLLNQIGFVWNAREKK